MNYYPKKKLTISGRAPIGTDVNIFANDILLGSVVSDFYGNWNFSSREIINIEHSNLKLSATIASIKLHIDLPLSLNQLEQNILKTSSINFVKENNSWRLTRKISDNNYLYSEIFIKNSKSLSISQLLNSKKTYNSFDSKILK